MFEQVFPQHDLRVVNLAEVINTKIDRMLIDSLHTFDLLHRKRKTKDIKRFFYHHIALTICEEFTADLTAGKCIFFFNPSEVGNLELYNYYAKKDVLEEICRAIKHINKCLPVRIHVNVFTFDKAMTHIQNRTGEGIELAVKLKELAHNTSDFTFAKMIKYTLDEELSELNRLFTSFNRHRLMLA